MWAMDMLINFYLFFFVNLVLATLLYWVPAGEPKVGTGRDFSPPPKMRELISGEVRRHSQGPKT